MENSLKIVERATGTAISKIENGTRPATGKEIKALCQALGVTPDWLFGD